MKNRILSIMDTGKKRLGVTLLCAVLLLTLGVGAAFAASSQSGTAFLNLSDTKEIAELLSKSKDYAALGELDVLGQINAGKGLGLQTNNGQVVCLYNNGDTWNLAEGQEVLINLGIKCDGTPTAINVGYICKDGNTGKYQATKLVGVQIIEEYAFDFTAPVDSDYYFFFANFSAGIFQLNYFEVTPINGPVDYGVAVDDHIIPILNGKTYVDLTHGGSIEADENDISAFQLFTNSTEISVSIPKDEDCIGTVYLYAIDGGDEVNQILEFVLDSKNPKKTFTGMTSSRNYYIEAVGFGAVRITISD